MDINQEEWEARLGSDLSRVCRLCLKTCETFHPIFNASDPANAQAHKIMACAQVKVFEGDGLPTHVCHSCHGQVERSYQFKLLCERSDNKLRGSIVNINGGSDTDEVEDSDEVDMTQLTPEVIIDEEPPINSSPHNQVEWSKSKDGTSRDVYSKIMQSVLSQVDSKSSSAQLSQKKPPVYLKGLPGFVHSNQEMARMAVAMALHQRSVEEQERRAQEKQKHMELQIKQQQMMLRQRRQEHESSSSSQNSKSRRCRNGVKAFKCTQCNKSYSFSSALSRHKAVHNPQLRPHFCTICKKGFTQVEKLMRHQRTHTLDSAAMFKASMAYDGRMASYLLPGLKPHSSLMNPHQSIGSTQSKSIDLPMMKPEHIEISIRPDIYPDSDEDDDEEYPEDYHRLEIPDESNKPDEAPVENKKTSEKPSVEIKMEPTDANEIEIKEEPPELTKKIKKEPPEISNKIESDQQEITDDEKIDFPPPTGKGKPEFRCPVCLKCFATRGSLEVHSNIHTGVRPFICKICQQAFRHKVNLIEHFQRKHSQVRPYHCDVCASRFVTKQELLRHYRKHIGE